MDGMHSIMNKFSKGWLVAALLSGMSLTGIASEQQKHKTPDTVVDFGWTNLDRPVRKRIELPNPGNVSLKIREILVSCDCLNVIRHSNKIEPQDSGYLDVLMLPDKTDEVKYRIHVEFANDAGCHEVLFKGMVDNAKGESFRDYGNLKHLLRYATPGREKAKDSDLYVDLQKLGSSPVFVDVRPSAAFKQARIPGSLNIQPYAIRSKAFLRSKQVVLIGDDPVGSSLEGLCRELRKSGFAGACILEGGIGRWASAGKPITGTALNALQANRVSADQMRVVAASKDWKVVVADESLKIREQVLVPGGEHIPFNEPKVFAERLKGQLAKSDEALLIITRDGRNYGEIRAALNELKVPVYYLDGGFDAYEAKLQMLVDMEESQTATVSYMPSGKKTTGGRRIKKSCGCSG